MTEYLKNYRNPPKNYLDRLYTAFRGPACNDFMGLVATINNVVTDRRKEKPYDKYEPLYLYDGKRYIITRVDLKDKDKVKKLENCFEPKSKSKDSFENPFDKNLNSKMRSSLNKKMKRDQSYPEKFLEVKSETDNETETQSNVKIKKIKNKINKPADFSTERRCTVKPIKSKRKSPLSGLDTNKTAMLDKVCAEFLIKPKSKDYNQSKISFKRTKSYDAATNKTKTRHKKYGRLKKSSTQGRKHASGISESSNTLQRPFIHSKGKVANSGVSDVCNDKELRAQERARFLKLVEDGCLEYPRNADKAFDAESSENDNQKPKNISFVDMFSY